MEKVKVKPHYVYMIRYDVNWSKKRYKQKLMGKQKLNSHNPLIITFLCFFL